MIALAIQWITFPSDAFPEGSLLPAHCRTAGLTPVGTTLLPPRAFHIDESLVFRLCQHEQRRYELRDNVAYFDADWLAAICPRCAPEIRFRVELFYSWFAQDPFWQEGPLPCLE